MRARRSTRPRPSRPALPAVLGGRLSQTTLQIIQSIRSLSDDDVLQRLAALLRASRRVEAVLVAHIGEVDARRLYAREASQSVFSYCNHRPRGDRARRSAG